MSIPRGVLITESEDYREAGVSAFSIEFDYPIEGKVNWVSPGELDGTIRVAPGLDFRVAKAIAILTDCEVVFDEQIAIDNRKPIVVG